MSKRTFYALFTIIFVAMIISGTVARAERLLPKGSIVMDTQKWRYNNRPGYFSVELRPMFCMKNCTGSVVTYGLGFGYKYIGAGFRYGYSDGSHWLIPDLRLMYPIILGRRFAIEPMFEFSPVYRMTSSAKGKTQALQLTLRPGLRVRFQVTPEFNIYLEPILLDVVVHTWAWVSGGRAAGLSINNFIMRYEFGFGLQYRFR